MDIFDFKSDKNMMLDNVTDIGNAEPAEKVGGGGGGGGGGVRDTGKRTSGKIKNKRQWRDGKVEQGEKGDALQQVRSICKGMFCPVTNWVLQVDQCDQEAGYNH